MIKMLYPNAKRNRDKLSEGGPLQKELSDMRLHVTEDAYDGYARIAIQQVLSSGELEKCLFRELENGNFFVSRFKGRPTLFLGKIYWSFEVGSDQVLTLTACQGSFAFQSLGFDAFTGGRYGRATTPV